MIVLAEKPRTPLRKSEFSKVIGYKTNIQKSIVLLYICNKYAEITSTILLTMAQNI